MHEKGKKKEAKNWSDNLIVDVWKSKMVANNWLRHSVITTWSCQGWAGCEGEIILLWLIGSISLYSIEKIGYTQPSLSAVKQDRKGWIFWLIFLRPLLKCLSRTQNMAKYFLILAKNNIWKVRKFGMTKILVIHSTWRRKTSQLSVILNSLSVSCLCL